jgi:hypothetical protein
LTHSSLQTASSGLCSPLNDVAACLPNHTPCGDSRANTAAVYLTHTSLLVIHRLLDPSVSLFVGFWRLCCLNL